MCWAEGWLVRCWIDIVICASRNGSVRWDGGGGGALCCIERRSAVGPKGAIFQIPKWEMVWEIWFGLGLVLVLRSKIDFRGDGEEIWERDFPCSTWVLHDRLVDRG